MRVKELPEMDDEWAKSLGEDFDSLATLEDEDTRGHGEACQAWKPTIGCAPT